MIQNRNDFEPFIEDDVPFDDYSKTFVKHPFSDTPNFENSGNSIFF